MLQTEFKELMGLKEVSEETYTQADKIYIACDLSKKVFCDLYKHCSAEAILLLDNIATLINEKNRYITQLSVNNTMLKGKLNKQAEVALRSYSVTSSAEDATEFFDMAVNLIGYHETVLLCLKKGYPLNDKEREYIINEMKG